MWIGCEIVPDTWFARHLPGATPKVTNTYTCMYLYLCIGIDNMYQVRRI